MSGSGDTPGAGTTRTRVVAALIGLVVILALVLVVPRLIGGDSEGSESPSGSGSTAPDEQTPAPEPTDATPTDAPPPGQAGGDEAEPSEGDPSGSGEAEVQVNTQAPVQVELREPARPDDDLRLSVTRVEKVRSRAELPGETSRPALRITVRVDNLSREAVPIGGALTNLYYGPQRDAATLVQRPGGRPFPAEVEAGGSASSVVVYNVPRNARGRIVLEVSLDATIRRVEFSGDCSADC